MVDGVTTIEAWLNRSWERFARRWWVMVAVSGIAGAATLSGIVLPALGGMLVSGLGRWSPWLVWGVAGGAALLAALWLSTWAQAAAIEAARGERGIGECLADGWVKTGPFAWALSLELMATGGAFFLLLLPGLWLAPLFFWAPFIALSEGLGGVEALEASWRRVYGRWWAVAGRLALVAAVPFAVGLIPIAGFFLSLAAGPFTLFMLVELAEQLRASDPGPSAPAPRLAWPVAVLSGVFLAASWFVIKAGLAAALTVQEHLRSYLL